MAGRFDSFVILAGMRTGSNFLEANLNALPGVLSHGEAFNPHFIGKKNRVEYLGLTIAQRDRDPFALLAMLKQATDGLSGFRLFDGHDPRILTAVLADPGCAKIILSRNPLESYVSLKIAQATGQWKLTNPARAKTAQVRFDTGEFEAHLDARSAFQREVLHGLQTTGQTGFCIDYADITDLAVLNGLAAFLGLDTRLGKVDGTLKKQNAAELSEVVENPAEMSAALERIDRLDYDRAPSLEPRRHPGLWQFVASADAPLLFLPIRGGPQGITAWLGKFGETGLIEGFGPNRLWKWKRGHPGFRSFTVLRHPVPRAYSVFAGQVMTGEMPDVRAALVRLLEGDLPGPDDLAGRRKAFLTYLRIVRQSLSSQSHLRVAAAWASQSAILHGFAEVQLADHLLREERLGEGLAQLAAEIGLPCPPVPVSAPPGGLEALYDDEVEAAVRDAYQRDYVSFGFSRWR